MSNDVSACLIELQNALREGHISREQIESLLHDDVKPGNSNSKLMRVVGILGAVISFTGLSILIAQHWAEFGSLMRVTLTLGSGLVAYIVAILLFLDEERKSFSGILCIIAILLVPGGLGVALHEAGYDLAANSTQLLMSFVLLATFAAPAIVLRSNVMLIGAVWALTALFFVSTNMLVDGIPQFDRTSFHEYRALITGGFYMLLAYASQTQEFKTGRGFLFLMGSAVTLCAAYCLMGWKPTQSVTWEILYPCIAYAAIFGGVHLRHGSMTVNGVIAMNAYVVKISAEYFAASLGWPLAMIFAGMGVVAIALYSVNLHQTATKDTVELE